MYRGRRKQTLREFTRELPSKEDQERFREAMNADSDLESAILQAIELEYLLEQIIIAKLKRKDEDTAELLCRDNGPLSTFSSKIGLGYAMGIFDIHFMAYLNTVRRIRNAFAHSRRSISFATPLIRNEMASLKSPRNKRSQMHKSINIIKELLSTEMPIEHHALTGRAGYAILCMSLANFFFKRQTLAMRVRARAHFAKAIHAKL